MRLILGYVEEIVKKLMVVTSQGKIRGEVSSTTMGKKMDSRPYGDLRIRRRGRSEKEDNVMVKAGNFSVMLVYNLMNRFKEGGWGRKDYQPPRKT